jgi:cation diffusion facilitator CzcD-associated flavoprotein CzcO
MKVAVIGAGPSGLVTLKYLSTAHHYFPIEPIEVICIEAESDLGGTFKYRVYEDAEASLSWNPRCLSRLQRFLTSRCDSCCSWYPRNT